MVGMEVCVSFLSFGIAFSDFFVADVSSRCEKSFQRELCSALKIGLKPGKSVSIAPFYFPDRGFAIRFVLFILDYADFPSKRTTLLFSYRYHWTLWTGSYCRCFICPIPG